MGSLTPQGSPTAHHSDASDVAFDSPAHPYRYRRFACPLAGTGARLAEKRGSVTPSLQGTCTPYLLPVRLAHQNFVLPYSGDGPSELRAIAEEAERRIGLPLDRGPPMCGNKLRFVYVQVLNLHIECALIKGLERPGWNGSLASASVQGSKRCRAE